MHWWRILDGKIKEFRSTSQRVFCPGIIARWHNGIGRIYPEHNNINSIAHNYGPITLEDFKRLIKGITAIRIK
jgi:hypothetical protein